MSLAKYLYRRCAKSLVKEIDRRTNKEHRPHDSNPEPTADLTMNRINAIIREHAQKMDSDPEFKRSEMRRGGKNFLNLFFTEPIVRKMVLMAILEKSAGLSYDDLKEP